MKRILGLVIVAACGGHHAVQVESDADSPADASPDAPVDAVIVDCPTASDTTPMVLATAAAADEYTLQLNAAATSPTSWGESGNEAVVLEIAGAQRGLIAHVVLHQGSEPFVYAMHLGALAAGEVVDVRVSALTAAGAAKVAAVCGATLTPVSMLDPAIAPGVLHAPVFHWPVQKAFDDLPMVVGWSKARADYQTVMTNENGGTAMICGGGATGMEAEIGRWGRSTDIEGHYSYSSAPPTWERCTGRVTTNSVPLRMEGDHPQLYWGDGHNRLFEDRSGYGQTCGTGSPEKPDGDVAGWNVDNPGNTAAQDSGHVIVLRPLPVELDPLGYAQFGGRREALADHYAPWLYRIASLELAREHKIDNAKTFGMSRYLYADVRVADVGGVGDSYCPAAATGGFKLRAVTTTGTVISSGQITAAYASNGNHDWKRVAIALPAGIGAADIDHFEFDAYNGDGIYLTAIGDAFVPKAAGASGATLAYVRQGVKVLQYYVDDDSSGCTNGVNTAGPGGLAYTCAGGSVSIPP